MKQIKKMLGVLMALALCVAATLAVPVTAQANGGGKLYSLKDVGGEWRYQEGAWDPEGAHHELYYMFFDLKDGDLMVIDGSIELHLKVDVKLKNLTILNCPSAIVATKGVEEFYALNGSGSSITGDVTKADVYDNCIVNFNSNVKKLNVYSEKEDILTSTVGAVGTVDHVYAGGVSGKHFEFYNFKANTLLIENGTLMTDESNFSEQPTGQVTPGPSAPSDEYDEVPKTADIRFNPMWLVCVAAVSMTGYFALRKKNN